MGEPADPLGPAERRAIAEAFAGEDPPASAAALVRSRLEAAIPEMRPPSTGRSNRSGVAGWRGGIGWPIATFFLGAIVSMGLMGALRSGSRGRRDGAQHERPASTQGHTLGASNDSSASDDGSHDSPQYQASAPRAPTLAIAPPNTGVVPAGSGPAPHESFPSPASSQLNAERRVLDLARSALVAEDANEALRRVGDHLARFPNGFLSEEREAIAIQALVKARRYDEARARARLFRVRSPDSLFTSAVDSALTAIP